ncbi:MAG: dihydrolipoyl dehydrogenase [Chloroflexi bacterium]|nr:dihydrolipoyl dehydrogenase [Chloroflexota bacterium]
MTERYDIAILGGGPGGYVAALHAGVQGARVALIEKDRVGGTCVTVGCIPSKALLDTSHSYWMATHAAVSGLHLTGEFDLAKAMARKDQVVKQLVGGIEQLLKARKVDLFKAEGELVSPTEIRLGGGDGPKSVQAGATIVATGSAVALPPIQGLKEAKPLDNVGALDLRETPKRLVVIGGGVIGMELGAFYSEIGSDVTVLEMLPAPLAGSDPDLVRLLVKALESHGRFRVVTNAKVTAVERRKNGTAAVTAEVEGKEETFEGDEIVLGAGRVPNVKGADGAGLAMGKRGVQVDDRMRTSVGGVYAIGDCTAASFENRGMLAHVASTQGEVAVDTILGHDAKMDYDVAPSVVYTHPELASVGLSEQAAKERCGEANVKVSRFPFRASGRALALGESDGMTKLITTGKEHRIVGVHVMGPQASELIAEATLAIRLDATAHDIIATVHSHPTLAETLREAALVAVGRAIHTASR